MFLKSLKVEGFMAFQAQQEIEFRKGLTYVLGDNRDDPTHMESNGAGKTTILSAISWALYGKIPGGGDKDTVIGHQSERALVTLHLSGEVSLQIERVKQRGKSEILKFKVGTSDWTKGKLEDTQARLTEYLGIDASTFWNTIYISKKSDSVKFLTCTPSQRAAVMANIIDDSVFQKVAHLVDEDMSQINDKIKGHGILQRELDYAEERLRSQRKDIESSLEKIRMSNSERKEKIVREVSVLKKKISDQMANFVDATTYNLDELYAKKQAVRKKIDGVTKELGAVSGRLKSVRNLNEGESCPVCEREIDRQCAERSHSLRSRLEEDRRTLSEAQGTLEEQLEKIERWIEKTQEQNQNKDLALSRIDKYKAEIKHLEDQLQTQADTSMLEGLLKDNTNELYILEQRRAEGMTELEQFENMMPRLKFLSKAFKSDLRNILLDKVREGLKYYTSQRLTRFSTRIVVDYPSTTHTGAEKFDIVVTNNGHKQPLELFSGGEGWRIMISILLGLRKMLLADVKPCFGFLAVDDPVGELDDPGLKRFWELLEAEKEEIPQILVTVPRDLAPTGPRLMVTKKGDYATCERQ